MAENGAKLEYIRELERKVLELQKEIAKKDNIIAVLTGINKPLEINKNHESADTNAKFKNQVDKEITDNEKTIQTKSIQNTKKNTEKNNNDEMKNKPDDLEISNDEFNNSVNCINRPDSNSDSDWGELDGIVENNLTNQGKEIKQILKRTAHEPKFSNGVSNNKRPKLSQNKIETSSSLSVSSTSHNKRSKKLDKTLPDTTNGMDIYREEFSGIRLINPIISFDEMKRLMTNKNFIKLSNVSKNLNDSETDWVTMGVIVNKITATSKNGNKYGKWYLSDLSNCQKFVTFLLFGKVLELHWKTTVGSVIGLLNANIMDSSKDEISIKIQNPKNLLHLGTSKDFGTCTALTSKGNKCHNVVNTLTCRVCEFHLKKEHKKSLQKRPDLNTSYGGVSVPKKYSIYKDANMVFYGGQTYTNNSKKTKKVTLENIVTQKKKLGSEVPLFPLSAVEEKINIDKAKPNEIKREDEFSKLLLLPSPGALNLLEHLKKESGLTAIEEDSDKLKKASPIKNFKVSDILKDMRKPESPPTLSKTKLFPSVENVNGPQLGRGLGQWDQVDLDVIGSNVQKKKAIEKIRVTGGIEKEDPNSLRKSTNPHKNSVLEIEPKDKLPVTGKAKLIGGLDLNDPNVRSLIDKTSVYSESLKNEEYEMLQIYFGKMEQREELELKMSNTFSLECKVVSCKQCNYIDVSKPGKVCKQQNHQLIWRKAKRRFFKCKECSTRICSVDKIPIKPCEKCGAINYERTSMLVEKKIQKLPNEQLQLTAEVPVAP